MGLGRRRLGSIAERRVSTIPAMSEIIRLQRTQRARAVESLTRAFQNDPMWSCVLPDVATRAEAFRPMWDALIGYSRIYGEVYTTIEAEGAACWVAPGNTKATLWKMVRAGMGLPRAMMRLPKDARDRFFGMMRFIDKNHEELMPGPHWYLWALGVDPDAQGRGIGGALLRPVLDRADADGVSCYLETQTEANVAFYRSLGFEVVREDREPVGGLPIWFMVREPATGGAS